MRRLKILLTAIGVLLLAAAVTTLVIEFGQDTEARIAAGARMEKARDAADAALGALVADMREKLKAGDLDADPPSPIHRWGTARDPEQHDFAVEMQRTFLEVSEGGRFARVPFGELAKILEATENVGPPVAGAGTTGAFEHLLLVDDHKNPGFRLIADAKSLRQRHNHRFDAGSESPGLDAIRKGRPCELIDGSPPVYKGSKSDKVVGVWGPVKSLPGWSILVETTEAEVLREAGGVELNLFGKRLATVRAWHIVLGLALLTLVGSAFLWIADRGGKVAVLLRVYRFAAPYKWGIVLVIVLGLFFALATAWKIKLAQELFDEVLVDPGADAIEQLKYLAWATVGVGIAMAITGFFRDYLQNFYSTQMIADVRVALGEKLISLPMGFFQRAKLGDLVARLERDVASLRTVLNQVFETAFTDPFVLVGALLAAFIMNAGLACVLLGLPIIVVPLFRIAKKVKKRAETRQILMAEISHVIFQMLAGIKVVKAFGGEQRETDRLRGTVARYMREARKLQRLSSLSKSMLDALQMAGGGLLVWFGGQGVLQGGVSVGELGGFMLVVQTCYQSSKQITSVVNKFIEAVPGTERVFEIFDAEDTLTDGAAEMPRGALKQGIEFRGVRFAYGKKEILKGIDLMIPAGKVVALVGPTGAGKTTLCDLVARFYDTTGGQVLFDGRDVREFAKKSLLANVAIVTQDAFLFNAPIEENLKYGNPGATQEEMESAARDAFVHDEILRMEGRYSKMAGERGTSLSGGQRQRVTIARALLKNAPVLILDEATSALDSHAESQVQAALAKLMAGRTVLVVAHRLSTIRNADHVVVLDQGAIVEQGPPSLLLNQEGGRFKEMWAKQMGEGAKGPETSGGRDDDDDAPEGPEPPEPEPV